MNKGIILGLFCLFMLRSISLSFRSVEMGISRRSFARLASRGETVKTKLLASLGKNSKIKGTPGIKDQAKSIIDSFSLKTSTTFTALGLDNNITTALEVQDISVPTPVQRTVIPRVLSGENLVMAASTGSGKTLAYTLPCLQQMHAEEENGYIRRVKRPRCLILVPTRELAQQVLDCVKKVGHYSKVSSTGVLGGEQFGPQKKALDRLVDVVVASPGRLMEHKKQGNVFLSQVSHVIIDEVDTMLTQGFGSDIRAILRSVVARNERVVEGCANHTLPSGMKDAEALASSSLFVPVVPTAQRKSHKEAAIEKERKPAQLIMATATLTKAVRALLNDVQGGFNLEFPDSKNPTPRLPRGSDQRVQVSVVEVDGVHRSLPNVAHVMEDVNGGADKLAVLRDVLERHHSKLQRTLIFCNTVASCRAVEYAINQDALLAGGGFSGSGQDSSSAPIQTISYHGDLHSDLRQQNLERFRNGEAQYMVCSDIAARGLDIPETGHVVMFDFPLNPIDYLHRAGRCGRAGRKGLVTALVAKRDVVLAGAIQEAIRKGLPLDVLTSDKKDYTGTGKLVKVMRKPRSENNIADNRGSSKVHYSRSSGSSRSSNTRAAFAQRGSNHGPSSRRNASPVGATARGLSKSAKPRSGVHFTGQRTGRPSSSFSANNRAGGRPTGGARGDDVPRRRTSSSSSSESSKFSRSTSQSRNRH